MTPPVPAPPKLEPNSQVLRILEGYLEGLEHGRHLHPDELVAQHPELAEPLRACLASLEVLHDAALSLRGGGPPPPEPPAEAAPDWGCLGDFRLLREVGRGGMGVVYEAEQVSLRRRVALKVLPFAAALDGKTLRRFQTEAQAAAGLHHSNIVPVYAVGCERGVHFYAMQFIDGRTLAELIAELRDLEGRAAEPASSTGPPAAPLADDLASGRWAPPRPGEPTGPPAAPASQAGEAARDTATMPVAGLSTERSARSPGYFRTVAYLGAQAAEALEHAHQLGVVHRDVKPANLLLDGRGHLWVTDFGLAQVKSGAELTATGDLVGTLRYMSPEQAQGKPASVDHRTDVYSLGATLYELLTLTPAFAGTSREQLLSQITFQEPPPPRRLNSTVPADLETIVLKAMAKGPAERYATAQELADDLRRFLEDKAIRARRPTPRQRLGRFMRRHKRVLSTAAVFLVLGLAATTAVLAVSYAQVREAEELARGNAKEALAAAAAERKAKEAEAAERKQAEEVAGLLHSVFEGLDPQRGVEDLKDQLVRSLDEVAADLETKYPGQPLMRGRLRNALGITQQGLGEYAKATPLFQQALEEYRSHLGANHPATLAIMSNLAGVYLAAGELIKAVRLSEQVLEKWRARCGPDHPDTLQAQNSLAGAYLTAGQLAKAVSLFEQGLRQRRARLGPDDPDTLVSLNNLAGAYQAQGQWSKAVPLYEQALEKWRAQRGPHHPSTLTTMHNLASAYLADGQWAKAVPLFEQVLAQRRARLGPDHPHTLTSLNGLGVAYQHAGQSAKALSLFEQAVEQQQARLGPDHPSTLTSKNNLARSHLVAGQWAKAVPLFEQVLAQRRARLGPDHPHTLDSLNGLARAYQAAGQLAKALPLFEQALKQRRAKLGPDHPDTLMSLGNLASVYRDSRRLAEAVPLFEQMLEKMRGKVGADHPNTLTAMMNLVDAYLAAGKLDKAEPLLREVLARRRQKDGTPSVADLLGALGVVLLKQSKYAEAEPFLRECLDFKTKQQPDHWATFNAHSLLGGALLGQKKYAAAEPLLLEGYDGMRQRAAKMPALGQPRLAEAMERLVQLYDAWDKKDKAAQWRQKLDAHKAAAEKAKPKEK
jgi:serine/threonine protein kinase/Tfp pilus assembly protein PilF